MTEPTERLPISDPETLKEAIEDEQTYDPQDLVSKGGYIGDPREIVSNPAVAPQPMEDMDLRDDLRPED